MQNDAPRTAAAHLQADVTLVLGDQPVTVTCQGMPTFTSDDWRDAAIASLLQTIRIHRTRAEVLGVEPAQPEPV